MKVVILFILSNVKPLVLLTVFEINTVVSLGSIYTITSETIRFSNSITGDVILQE